MTEHTAPPGEIRTERLRLVPADPAVLRAALAGNDSLAEALSATVPPTWPPDLLGPEALEYTLVRLESDPAQRGWSMVLVLHEGESPTLIGSGGYKGPPDPGGTVEIGYSIVRDRRRRGYATEMVRGLVGRAFEDGRVLRVIAETLPELEPSIGVLRKCGFGEEPGGSEPGVLRFALERAAESR